MKILGKRVPISQARDIGTLANNESVSRTPDGYRRIRGTHSYGHPQEWKSGRQTFHPPNSSYNGNGNFPREPLILLKSHNIRLFLSQDICNLIQ